MPVSSHAPHTASYPENCERRHYAVCWGDLDKQRNNPAIWDNNCRKNNKNQDYKNLDNKDNGDGKFNDNGGGSGRGNLNVQGNNGPDHQP